MSVWHAHSGSDGREELWQAFAGDSHALGTSERATHVKSSFFYCSLCGKASSAMGEAKTRWLTRNSPNDSHSLKSRLHRDKLGGDQPGVLTFRVFVCRSL